MLIHQLNIIKPDPYFEGFGMVNILALEEDLILTCKEYSIDYNTLSLLDVPINEGIIGSIVQNIKALFRKAIQILIKLWKGIANFVKTIIQTVAGFFKKIFGRKDLPDKINITSTMTISPGKAETKRFISFKDMEAAHKKALNNFSSEIAKLEKENVSYTKRLEKHSLQTATESIQQVIEKVIYWDKPVPGLFNKRNKKLTEIDDNDPNITATIKTTLSNNKGDQLDDCVFPASDEFSYMNNNYIDLFPIQHAEWMKEFDKDNHVGEKIFLMMINEYYNDLKIEAIDRLMQKLDKYYDLEDSMLKSYIKDLGNSLETCKGYISESEFKQSLSDTMFPSFNEITDPNERATAIKQWVYLKLNWNRNVILSIQRMIELNQRELRLSKGTVYSVAHSSFDMIEIRKILQRNLYKMISDDGNIIDGRKFGLGVFVQSDEMVDAYFNGERYDYDAGSGMILRNPSVADSLIVSLTKYDLSILSHGNDYNNSWTMQMVPLPNGYRLKPVNDKNEIDVNEYIKECVKQGFKRIQLISCNPGHHKLEPSILTSKKVLVVMGSDSIQRPF